MARTNYYSCSKRQVAGFLLVGLVAGFVSYLTLQPINLFYYFTPGLIFGIALTLFLPKLLGISIEKSHLAFILFSTFSYFVAFLTYFGLTWSYAGYGNVQLSVLYISGLVGSLIFIFGYIAFVKKVALPSFLLLVFWGAFLSLFFYPALIGNPQQTNAMNDLAFSWGFMIWQGGMALGLGLVTVKKMQNPVVTGLLLLFFGLCGLAVIRNDIVTVTTQKFTSIASYQEEVSGIVSPDFTLTNSGFKNQGLDVGTVLTDYYKTSLQYPDAFAIMNENAAKKGYILTAATIGGSCLGGYEAQTARGRLDICQTNYANGVRTFEISLYNFDNAPQ